MIRPAYFNAGRNRAKEIGLIRLTTLSISTINGRSRYENSRRSSARNQPKTIVSDLNFIFGQDVQLYSDSCSSLLRTCAMTKALEEGRLIHAHIIKTGLQTNVLLINTLINVYVKCGSMSDARQVFDTLASWDVFTWTTMISGYAKTAIDNEAISLFRQMQDYGLKPDKVAYVSVLSACSVSGAVEWGKLIHSSLFEFEFLTDVFVSSALVGMYAKCGEIKEACKVFEQVPSPDVVCWNSVMSAYIQHGNGIDAFKFFIQNPGFKPTKVTYASILISCGNSMIRSWGKLAHSYALNSQLESDIMVGNSLINMYSKCGTIEDAHKVFDRLHGQDVVSWTAMISGYVEFGHRKDAARLFQQMLEHGVQPNKVTYLSILNACIKAGELEWGKYIHVQIVKSELESDVSLSNTMVAMYTKCGNIKDAYELFDRMPTKNVVSWNALISGYVYHAHVPEAVALFEQMRNYQLKPDNFTYASILSACTNTEALECGKRLHFYVVEDGLESDTYVANTLISMYLKCGTIRDARHVFNRMVTRDLISWTLMVSGYAQVEMSREALLLFVQMIEHGLKPNKVIYVSILTGCTRTSSVIRGKHVHAHLLRAEQELDVFVGSSLVNMYAKCQNLKDACDTFDRMPKQNLVSWNAAIIGYAHYGSEKEAFKLFNEMHLHALKPDKVTFVSILIACANAKALQVGKLIHCNIIKVGCETDLYIGSALIGMYSKHDVVRNASQIFDRMATRNAVSWTVMIAAYADHGCGNEALKLFWEMQQHDIMPDRITLLSILNACANIGAIGWGREVHRVIMKVVLEFDVFVKSAVVDMYFKCGSIVNAHDVFKKMPARSLVSWTTVIAGYAQHGCLDKANELFIQMQRDGIRADDVTFTAMLTACSNVGAIDAGCHNFASMASGHRIKPKTEHYSCMMNNVGRAGWLDEAKDMIDAMPIDPGIVLRKAFLAACTFHGNPKMAEHAITDIYTLGAVDAAAIVTLSNVYATVDKSPDYSLIEAESNLEKLLMEAVFRAEEIA